jgi:hypothetical protein
MSDFSRGEDETRALSGMQKKITAEVGTWDLNVRFVHPACAWIVEHGALHFHGAQDGTLTCWIETADERKNS